MDLDVSAINFSNLRSNAAISGRSQDRVSWEHLLGEKSKVLSQKIVFVNAWVCGRIGGWRQERKAGWQSRPRCNPKSLRAKSLQLWPTLWGPMDCRSPGSFDHGILQARIPEWAAISSSRGSSQPRDWTRSLISAALQAGSLSLAPPRKPMESLVHRLLLFCILK